MVDKGFLNSFLVLSLLINIYKAERELPENKLELYQKCFEYISNKREKEKSQEKYDWALISTLMKDNTFMELANLCLPNNSDVSKDIIKERLTQIYKTKYVSENQTELAIDQFLIFCSDRTELFVPASGEDCFKFFHRSFFEYFYSQYIFTRMSSVEEIYDAWRTFDVDSEIFELTLAMFKQKNESKYQEIVEFLLKKLEKAFSNNIERINVMNMLVLCMQVIDDELYKKQFVNFIVDNVEFCNKNIQKIHNQGFIINVINSNNDYKDMVINRYGDIAIYESVIAFLKVYPEAEQFLKQNSKRSDFNQQVEAFKFRFEHFYNFNFCITIRLENGMQYTRESAIERLLKNYEPYYDIHMMINGDQSPITARCDFFEHSGQYVISKKAELWSAENEEFLYLLNIPHLTLPLFEQWRDYIHEDGMKRIHVGPGHMASYITAVFVCDTCDEDALKALKKCRIYKSFHFSLHGWMDFHAAVLEVNHNKITTNRNGKCVEKVMKNVLFQKKRGRIL